jgi:hypothetical protein
MNVYKEIHERICIHVYIHMHIHTGVDTDIRDDDCFVGIPIFTAGNSRKDDVGIIMYICTYMYMYLLCVHRKVEFLIHI